MTKFVRSNPMSDKIDIHSFHHVEFYAGDATSTYKRFMHCLGLELVAKSDFSTGNDIYASYVCQSGDCRFVFTAPYYKGPADATTATAESLPLPGFTASFATEFFTKHGLAVRAVGAVVTDVKASHDTMVANGGVSVLAPTKVVDKDGNGWAEYAEVQLYGDVVIRLLDNSNSTSIFLPNFEDCFDASTPVKRTVNGAASRKFGKYGLERFDHIVGNVPDMNAVRNYIKNTMGFHEFAEFTAEDVGTVDSGLNSVVLANNSEMILFPVNEPTFGTKRKSQIQTFLEQNQGEGVQHMALFTQDVFETMRLMRAATELGGFEFMPSQGDSYYKNLRNRINVGDVSAGADITEEQLNKCAEMGILVDKDDQGVLLQIFTKPIGDRPTAFFEIIQRVGCKNPDTGIQKPGCGGFGKGNFKDLFKSIEDYENALNINTV